MRVRRARFFVPMRCGAIYTVHKKISEVGALRASDLKTTGSIAQRAKIAGTLDITRPIHLKQAFRRSGMAGRPQGDGQSSDGQKKFTDFHHFTTTLTQHVIRITDSAWGYRPGNNPKATYHYVEYTPWLYTLQPAKFCRMNIRETFAKNLRAVRRDKGLSQEELAHRAELDRTYISALERNVYNPTIDVVGRLAEALRVEPATLLQRATGEDEV